MESEWVGYMIFGYDQNDNIDYAGGFDTLEDARAELERQKREHKGYLELLVIDDDLNEKILATNKEGRNNV